MAEETSITMTDAINRSATADIMDCVRVDDEPNAGIEINHDYKNTKIMIDTDLNEIDNKLHSINQKKRKPSGDVTIVRADGDNCKRNDAIYDVMYEIVQRANKRQKLEIKKKLSEDVIPTETSDVASTNHVKATTDKRKSSFKPPVPPKPKNLVCRPPAIILNNSQLRTKIESNHAATVQKLNAHAEQLRQENNQLRTALSNERIVVRTLR